MAHNGHENGAVLPCYGWIKLCPENLSSISVLSPSATPGAIGLLLEYVDGMTRITPQNYNHGLGERAIRALTAVHASGILVDKVDSQRVFSVSQKPERVVWFGFSSARCRGSDVSVRRQDFLEELASAWDYFYAYMVRR